MAKMDKAYEPKQYEDKIYADWERSSYFRPEAGQPLADNPQSYTIVLPPPNVTGTLHMGHAGMLAYEDILIRFNRMQGKRALWVPGTDHAAIATQTKVEKLIKEEGLTRHKLGREKFLERVRDFAQNSHDTIVNQTKKMGSSLDWSREAYTLDETRSQAVRSVFKMMYDDGLIYRGERIVNWCPRCHSTLADDEVEYQETKSKLYYFKYSKDFPITIATTRPETKLGDTAVAVNPKDERYKDLVGKEFKVDFVGVPLQLKIIADREVDAEFGAGALGVTPAHAQVDWQMAEENGLEIIKVIDEDGRIKENFGEYSGLSVKEAREKVVKILRQENLMEKEEEIDNKLSLCYRCDEIVEPLPSLQWFVDVNRKIPRLNQSIKELSLGAVNTGVFGREPIKIVPERFEKNYFHWMENLRDWCISRQIWFGHQVPVWYRRLDDPIEITFIRHREAEHNAKNVSAGMVDTNLTDRGRRMGEELREKLKDLGYDQVFVSGLKRTHQTAEIVFPGQKYIEDKRLNEIDFGETAGMSYEETDLYRETRFPGGESYFDGVNRLREFLHEAAEKYPGRKIAIIGHSGTWKCLEHLVNYQALNLKLLKQHGPWEPVHYTLRELMHVGLEAPRGEAWVQDKDTLDTWFSSGLWTFSTLAHDPAEIKIIDDPDSPLPGKKLIINSEDFRNFHPTQVLETGYDILFFWVARMIIMTTYAIGDIPFETVYLHGLVLDDQGKKMSKSKGNVIDPLDMIAKYGTDATRLSLVMGATPGQDMRLSEEKIAGFRNLVNKIWNVSRYILQSAEVRSEKLEVRSDDSALTLADKWILGEMDELIKSVTDDLENYRFSHAGEELRDFTWNKLADWYLEATKFQKSKETPKILLSILSDLLKLWHPFIPYVTEAIWSELNDSSLIISPWPKLSSLPAASSLSSRTQRSHSRSRATGRSEDPGSVSHKGTQACDQFTKIQEIIESIRNARAENKVEPSRKIRAVFCTDEYSQLIHQNEDLIKNLRTGIEVLEVCQDIPEEKAIFVAVGEIEIYLLGAIDEAKEKERLNKEIANLDKLIAGAEAKLNNKEFTDKAPAAVVKKQKDNLDKWAEERRSLEEQVKNL